MLHFFGNCQTAFLCDVMARRGHETRMHTLATPITAAKANGRIPQELTECITKNKLNQHLLERSLTSQFQLLDDAVPAPQVAVFNLFHENSPLFAHTRDDYVFFIHPGAMEQSQEFDTWLRTNCRLVKVNPDTYFSRFSNMVEWFRARRPHTPIIILTRLSHFPMFGPHPYSYLECWEHSWWQAVPELEKWAASLTDCHVINLDRIFGGIWENEGPSIEAHCPFLRISLPEENEDGRLSIRRDLEHIGPMWENLAVTLEKFLQTGGIRYKPEERPYLEWMRNDFQPESLSSDGLVALLESGGNYQGARAVGSFFWRPSEDFSGLLAAKGRDMPVCHKTLHMVRKYAALKRNPALLPWIDAQQKQIRDFTTNGPVFRQRYENALEDMRMKLLGKTKNNTPPLCTDASEAYTV